MIEETENPGFVLVLQERRDDCPHQERRPFKAGDVTQLFKDFQLITKGGSITDCSTNGPACSFVTPANNEHFARDYDEVPCLHVPDWWFSDEFFTRHRRYNWPPKSMLENIKRYGLHLVPVGAPGSSTEKLQWRLSFSRAEVVVISDLPDLQRCAVIAFKICKTALGEEGKVIKSYFIKTALLWLCEQTPTEDWKSVTQGVLKLLDYLDHAVSSGYLPCFFWSRINLLRFASEVDRKVMKRSLGTIRQHYISILTHEICVLRPELQRMLTTWYTRRLPERQLRVCLIRWLIVLGGVNGVVYHMLPSTTTYLDELLPNLIRSYTPAELMRLVRFYSHWYHVQTTLYQALNVAPEDVTSRVHFSASGDGFVWDAAPLLELLNDYDLEMILGDPDAVRSWLRRHHQLPETERPAGTLPADLRSPRDLCDLLLNTPLLCWVLGKIVPHELVLSRLDEHEICVSKLCAIMKPNVCSAEQARHIFLHSSAGWTFSADYLQTRPARSRQTAQPVPLEQRQSPTRQMHSTSDPWQLKPSKLRDSP